MLAKRFDDAFYMSTVPGIKSVKRLVQDKQVGVFHEGSGQENQALLPTRKLKEATVLQVSNAEYLHPMLANASLLGFRANVEPYRVMKSACHDIDGRHILEISPMNLRTYVTDVFLDFPNALSRTTLATEERDIARITLRIIGTNQAQEGGFTRPVIARQGPLLSFPNYPIEFFQNGSLIVTDAYFVEADYFR